MGKKNFKEFLFRDYEVNMKNWWSDSELAETCCEFHCKYFTLHGCTNPYVMYCENCSLYWPFDILNEMERFR